MQKKKKKNVLQIVKCGATKAVTQTDSSQIYYTTEITKYFTQQTWMV